MKHQQIVGDYYEKLAPNYDEDRFGNTYGQFIHQQEANILKQLLSYPGPNKLQLDLGCGTGRLLEWATHGLDYSKAMVAEARKKFPEKNIQAGSALKTPYSDAQFSSVYSFHVLMHLQAEDIPLVVKEVGRILKSGGIFIFDIPSDKRRKLTNYEASNWHAAQSLSIDDIKRIYGSDWTIKYYTGVLFLPIHRFPNWLRAPLIWLDQLLCKSPWREYASYLVVQICKL